VQRRVRYIGPMVARTLTLGSILLGLAGCGASNPGECKSGAEGSVEKGAKTGVSGAKTGVKTGVEGVKTFGGAVGGLFTGGSDEAKSKWKKGKDKTRETAREGAADTKHTAHECP
jgi:hypothetical protein